MKFLSTLLVSLTFSSILFAQAPQKMNYQGVARDNNGNVLANQNIGLRLSILSGSISGTTEYSETQAVATNDFGLFNVALGSGSVLSGTINSVDWGSADHFIKVELDAAGGTSYSLMGTSQLLSVPYALYAETISPDAVDRTIILDADGDTKIEVEQSPDEDLIRFSLAGEERWKMTGARLEPRNTNSRVYIGENAGLNDDLSGSGEPGSNVGVGSGALFYNVSGAQNTAIGTWTLFNNVASRNSGLGHGALGGNTTGYDNTAIGATALFFNTTGTYNTAVGSTALNENIDGVQNTAIGTESLRRNVSGNSNAAVGAFSLTHNTTGTNNVAIGSTSVFQNTTGSENVGVGRGALSSNHEGSYNIAVGSSALGNMDGADFNSAVGFNSLFFNTTGGLNTAIGAKALYSNTIGISNTAVGESSLYSNVAGEYNTALGVQAAYLNTSGDYNVAIGHRALLSNTTGSENVAMGRLAMGVNTIGLSNTAVGTSALYANSDGNNNTALGNEASYSNNSGGYNTAIGHQALYSNISGNNNVAIGRAAMSTFSGGSNNIAIGFGAAVPTNGGSNQIRIGGIGISYAGIQVAWTTTSDKRWKSNIEPSALGLDFIKTLNPVSYTRNNDESQKLEYGFIAQELEKALNDAGAQNNGIISKDDEGMYGVRYNDLMAPMVKAIQEQQKLFESQQAQINELLLLLKK